MGSKHRLARPRLAQLIVFIVFAFIKPQKSCLARFSETQNVRFLPKRRFFPCQPPSHFPFFSQNTPASRPSAHRATLASIKNAKSPGERAVYRHSQRRPPKLA
jgi:hypothetical protein